MAMTLAMAIKDANNAYAEFGARYAVYQRDTFGLRCDVLEYGKGISEECIYVACIDKQIKKH